MKEEDKGFKMVYNKDDDESCGITNFNIAKFSQNLLANLIERFRNATQELENTQLEN